MIRLLSFSIVVLVFVNFERVLSQRSENSFSRVIYGDDDRKDQVSCYDYFLKFNSCDTNILSQTELSAKDKELGNSVAIIIKGENVLKRNSDGTYSARSATAESFWHLCENEKFSQQSVITKGHGYCTGFLLSTNPPLLGTAAHCYEPNVETVVIFGFEKTSNDETRLTFDENSVYFISGSPITGISDTDTDYSIVELDREVIGYSPYQKMKENLQIGTSITLIGHPVALPKKTDKGGSIQSISDSYIRGTIDSFGGNSGSPVFDFEGNLIGIFVAGTLDFVNNNDENCKSSNICPGGVNCPAAGEFVIPICKAIRASSLVNEQLGFPCDISIQNEYQIEEAKNEYSEDEIYIAEYNSVSDIILGTVSYLYDISSNIMSSVKIPIVQSNSRLYSTLIKTQIVSIPAPGSSFTTFSPNIQLSILNSNDISESNILIPFCFVIHVLLLVVL